MEVTELVLKHKAYEATELLLKHKAYVNSINNFGTQPLHVAVQKGCLQTVELLLKYGANVNSRCTSVRKKGYTPLHFAVEKGNKEIIMLLLSRGANVDVKGEDSITPLHIAAKKGYTYISEYLLYHGACIHSLTFKEGYMPIHFASEEGEREAVELFLDRGADINASTKGNLTPLHIATNAGHEIVVKLLLQRGAKVDIQDKDGKTVLNLAVENGYLMIVNDVLKYCPDINNQSNRSSLKTAVFCSGEKDKDIVEALLEHGLIFDTEDANDPELLHVAVEEGYLKIVEDLLRCGADVNAIDNSTYEEDLTLLHTAVINQHEEVAKLLISYGADVNAQDKTGKTPILYAVENADLKITKLLLTNRANVKDNPELLNIAVQKESIEIVESLLQHGTDINAQDKTGKTPIRYAIENADLKITKLLLTNRANVKDNPELLNIAVLKESIEIVESLLQHGAEINASDKYGITALHYTTFNLWKEIPNEEIKGKIAKLLLSKGANVNYQIENSLTTLEAASKNGYAKVVEVLLEYNANVNSVGKNDVTALHLSAQSGKEEITRMLLNEGANINAELEDGTTALHIAAEKGQLDVVKVLLEYGAKVNSKTQSGITPLHLGAQYGYQEIIETLVKFGADINSRDNYGRTALHIASKKGHIDFMETLLEYGPDINIRDRSYLTPYDSVVAGIRSFREERSRSYSQLKEYESDDDSAVAGIRSFRSRSCQIEEYDYDWNFSDVYLCEKFAKALVCHVVKLKTANLYVSEGHLLIIDYDRQSGIRFQKECVEEIASIKSEKITNTNISFYDILAKGTSSLAICMRNESIVQVLKSGNYKTRFPIYAKMIESNFRKCMERNKLLEEANKIFHFFFNNFHELPDDCNEKIFDYLSDKDLKCLIDTFKPLSTSNPKSNINDVVITSHI